MRLGTYGFEVGLGVDGRPVTAAGTYYEELDTTNPRSGSYALRISSETGVPTGTSTDVNTGASMAKLWSFENFLAESPAHPDGGTYASRDGVIVRAYCRWNTGDLPDASKAVEFMLLGDGGATNGRTALHIDHQAKLHFRRQTIGLRVPTPTNTVSTIVPQAWVVSDALALDTWHLIEVAFVRDRFIVRVNETVTFNLCLNPGSFSLATSVRLGWGMVFQGGSVITSTGSMGSNRNVYFDDVAINDRYDDGGGQHAFPGPGRVRSLRPADHDYSGAEVVDYSWVPGGPQCIFTDGGNGANDTLGDVLSQTPHPAPDPSPPPDGTTFKDAFWEALRLTPMHAPTGSTISGSGGDFGKTTGGIRGLGLGFDNINFNGDYGGACNYNTDGTHEGGDMWPDERNQDGSGGWPHEYMVTSGGSDWRGNVGADDCSDWEMVYPRTGGQDLLKLLADTPTFSGTVAVAHAWYAQGSGAANRTDDVTPPSGEELLTHGLKVWAPAVQTEPPDTPWQAVAISATRWPQVRSSGPTYDPGDLATDPRLHLKRTRSIDDGTGAGSYDGALSITCYGAGIVYEDQAGDTAELPTTCDFLLMIV